MFKRLLILSFGVIFLVACSSFGAGNSNVTDSPNVGSKEGSDMLFDQTLNASANNTNNTSNIKK